MFLGSDMVLSNAFQPFSSWFPFSYFHWFLQISGEQVLFWWLFIYWRKKTGGIHAKTVSVCVFTSLLLEIAFLAGLYPHLSMPILFGVNLVSTLLIFLFAPYNHPNMWLSAVEIKELRNRSRKTVIYEQCCIVVSWLMGYFSIARGLTTGVAMAAFLLSLAYINDWRKIYERKKRGNTQVH